MACADDEDELCDSIAFKLIYLPELISYIVFSVYESSALSLMLSLQKPPVVPCRRFFVAGVQRQPRIMRAREFGR